MSSIVSLWSKPHNPINFGENSVQLSSHISPRVDLPVRFDNNLVRFEAPYIDVGFVQNYLPEATHTRRALSVLSYASMVVCLLSLLAFITSQKLGLQKAALVSTENRWDLLMFDVGFWLVGIFLLCVMCACITKIFGELVAWLVYGLVRLLIFSVNLLINVYNHLHVSLQITVFAMLVMVVVDTVDNKIGIP